MRFVSLIEVSISVIDLLIHEINLPKFERINSLDELNTLVAGLQHDWNTTKIFEFNKLNMMNTHSCEGSFLMLDKHRVVFMKHLMKLDEKTYNKKCCC